MEKTNLKTKNKADLVEEVESLRRRISRLEKTESDHKDLAERLSAQNMLLQSITDSPSAISIVSTDLEGNVLFWNKGAENLLGYSAEEMAGIKKIGVVYPDNGDTKDTVREVVKFILAEKKGTTCEVEEIAKDGRRLWVKLTLSPRFDAKGHVIGILGIGENATERKLAEQALAERVRLAALGAEIGSALASSDTLVPMLQLCVNAVAKHIDVALTRIWILHTGDNIFELQCAAPRDRSGGAPGPAGLTRMANERPREQSEFGAAPSSRGPADVPDSRWVLEKIARERTFYQTNSVFYDAHFEDKEWIFQNGVVAFAGYPLALQNRLIGVLEVFSGLPITEASHHALAAISNEIAMGVERVWAYAAVRASEQRIRSIVANALDGIITIYKNGTIESFNPAAETIFGYAAREVVGEKVGLLIPDTSLAASGENSELDLFADGAKSIGRICEVTGRRKNGWTFPMEMAVSELQMPERRRDARPSEGERPILFLAIVRDITERKRFETALREERDYTGRLIEKTPALICGIAPGGTTKFANPAVEKTTGYQAGELIGKNWWRIFYPGDEYRQVERLFKELEKGNVVDYEMTLTTRSGDRRTVAWSSAHRYDESGAVIEIIGFGVDLTERKKWENALVLAAQKAEESNRLKSTFLSVMSHEFRTPLTVMLGNTPLLTDEKRLPPLPEIADIARDIEHSGKHLLALIDDLLDFSKIEAGKMALHLENVSARDLMKDVVSSVQVITSVKGLPIRAEVEDLMLAADKVRLKQILFNLFSNAIKFTDKGEIQAIVEKAGEHARFQIRDTGCGIAQGDLSFIFDAFRQADASATRGASGTGLGLAITKKLVEMHGGQISVESELGKWTALTFTIPLATQDLPYPVEDALSY